MSKAMATSAVAIALTAGMALAHGEGDYGLVGQGGHVLVGVGDHDTGIISDLGERVFASDMADNGTFWEADAPGIFIAEASLPDNTQVGFTVEAALLYWDGAGAVNFSIAADAMTLEFGLNSVMTPATDMDVAGFTLNYDADQAGGFDEHYDFLLDNSAPTGIYVLQNRFSLSGFADSESIWTVFNAGLDEDTHEEAIEWVEANLVPAPGTFAMFGAAGLCMARRRRR